MEIWDFPGGKDAQRRRDFVRANGSAVAARGGEKFLKRWGPPESQKPQKRLGIPLGNTLGNTLGTAWPRSERFSGITFTKRLHYYTT